MTFHAEAAEIFGFGEGRTKLGVNQKGMVIGMKKLLTALVAVVLLVSLVGCGTFSYNIKKYVNVGDYTDGKVVSVSQKSIDKAVEDALKSLRESYKGTKDKTEGTVAKDDTVYIYYEGTLVIFDGTVTIKVGSSGIKGFDEALKNATFKDGKAEFDLKLAEDFTVPEFVSKAIEEDSKSEESKTSGESEEEENPSKEESGEKAAVEAVALKAEVLYDDAETSPSPSKDETEKSPFASQDTHFVITVEGKNGKVADGEELEIQMRWTQPGFEGGTYNAETEEEEAKKEEEENKTSEGATESPSESEEEEEKRKGSPLKIGSGSFIDGFEDGLIGLSVAENTKTTLNLKFPNPYKNNEAYSGMKVDFDVTILSVTEEYERDLENAEQFADLKADYEEIYGEGSFDYADVNAYKADTEKSAHENAALTALLNASKMKRWPMSDYEKYLSDTRNQMWSYYYMMMLYGQIGSFSTEEELAARMGMTKTEYEQSLADQAGASLKRDLVLYQVAKDQGLTSVSDEDYKAYCTEQALDNGYTDEKDKTVADVDAYVDAMGGKKAVKKALVLERALEKLAELVAITE